MQKNNDKTKVDYEVVNQDVYNFVFYGAELALPLKNAGILDTDPDEWHQKYWAVDSKNQCWAGKEHCMELVDPLTLFSVSSIKDVREIIWAMGKTLIMADWVELAIDNNWIAPEHFYKNCTYSMVGEGVYACVLKRVVTRNNKGNVRVLLT